MKQNSNRVKTQLTGQLSLFDCLLEDRETEHTSAKTNGRMNILVACEESQAVTKELRRLGHNAFSCDIIECSGGHPEWHIMQDVLPLLNGFCSFKTQDMAETDEPIWLLQKWDMIIAFPPCTYLTVTGNRWFNVERYGEKAIQRHKDREDAIQFFMAFANADCDKIAIENPVGVMSKEWGKPNQIIQPWQFGHNAEKKTCLWLKGLPNLFPTVTEKPDMEYFDWVDKRTGKPKRMQRWMYDIRSRIPDRKERAKIASKTFDGIAKAIAQQWAGPAVGGCDENEHETERRGEIALRGV